MTDPNLPAASFAERHWRALLTAIVVLAVALRLYGLGRFSIWYDESTSLFALQYVDWDLRFLKAEETRLIPLNTLFLFFWYSLVECLPVRMGSQASDFLLHMLPGTFSALTVPLLFAFARRTTGRADAALAAAFIAAISPFHMYYASELGPHSLYAILVLLAAYANYRALEENRLRFWVASAAFEALAFYAYYFSVFYLAAVNLFVLLHVRTYRPIFWRWVACQAAALLLVLPAIVLAMFVFQMHATAAAHWFPFPTLKTLALTVKDWFAGYTPRPAVYWPLFAFGAIALALGALALRQRPRALAFLAIAAFLPPFIQYVFWNTQNFAFYTMRIQLAYSLPAFALAGAGLVSEPFRRARLALLAALAAFTVPALIDHYEQRIHPVFEHRMGVRYKVDNRGAADLVRANWQEGDKVAHASTVTLGPFLYHYLDAPQVFAVLGPEEWAAHLENYPDEKVWESLGFLPERIDEFVRDVPRVWLVSAGWEPEELFPHGILLRAWLDAHGARMIERHDGEVDVYLFDLAHPRPMDRIADFGWYVATQPAGTDIGAPAGWPVSRDPAALDVLFAQPDPGSDHAIVLARNRSANLRELTVTVHQAAEIQSSLAFSREENSNVWRPVLGSEGRVANWAHVTRDAPAGILSIAQPPGSARDLYIEIAREDPANGWQSADVTIELVRSDGSRDGIASLPAADAPHDDFWRWTPAGQIPELAEGATLVIRASLPSGADDARVQLGHAAWVSPDAGQWKPIMEETVTIEPYGQTKWSTPLGAFKPGVVWIEFYDAEYRAHRALSRHVGAP